MSSVSNENEVRALQIVRQCRRSAGYFIQRHCQIFEGSTLSESDWTDGGRWIPFHLWDAQIDTLEVLQSQRLVVILKARQLGLTWLVLAWYLWLALFRPAATILLFSRRDDEATDLLKRMRGIHERLPEFLQVSRFVTNNDHEWELPSGSRMLALPTTAGDSYTATAVLADEFDLVEDQNRLIRAVKPTIDSGGRMVLLSRADKSKPESSFKRVYRQAVEGKVPWHPVFLPWHARPDRDEAWYELQKTEIMARTGSLDDLNEQYPATDTEALAPRTLDKRIAAAWLHQCYQKREPLAELPKEAPGITGLEVYVLPQAGRPYVIGADPAEGNPTSDDSALVVLDAGTGEEVASLAGRFQPSTLGAQIDAVGMWYNGAPVMVERNNHGHAVLLWLRDNSRLLRMSGHDAHAGWLSSTLGKTKLYDDAADMFRNKETILHSFATFTQLASIDGSTLRAPEGEHDDRADAYALACVARIHLRRYSEDPGEPFAVGERYYMDRRIAGENPQARQPQPQAGGPWTPERPFNLIGENRDW